MITYADEESITHSKRSFFVRMTNVNIIKMKKFLYIAILFLTASFGYSQKNYAITFEELPQKMAVQPRPILIKMHTNWCSVCKLQDRQIENNKALQDQLAEGFYFIEFDAESKKPIVFNGVDYKFIANGTGGLHALAAKLSEAKASYPSWVLLYPDYAILARYNGLFKSNELMDILAKLK